jgi:hypothetical protein
MSNQEVINKVYELKSFAVKVQDYEMATMWEIIRVS